MNVSEDVKRENRRLCERFPFLIPSNRWTGHRITDKSPGYWAGSPDEPTPEYDYEYTELDEMPDGWRKAFGEQMCEEIRDELEKVGLLDEYRITQIKEKYGTLRWYSHFTTDGLEAIIRKYEDLSAYTCIHCGKRATRVTLGWISPFCDECCPPNERTKAVEEFWKEW